MKCVLTLLVLVYVSMFTYGIELLPLNFRAEDVKIIALKGGKEVNPPRLLKTLEDELIIVVEDQDVVYIAYGVREGKPVHKILAKESLMKGAARIAARDNPQDYQKYVNWWKAASEKTWTNNALALALREGTKDLQLPNLKNEVANFLKVKSLTPDTPFTLFKDILDELQID